MIDYSRVENNNFDVRDKKRKYIKNNKSFLFKLMYTKYENKLAYNELKNLLLKYGFKSRYTNRFENFKKGSVVFKISLNRTSLRLFMNLDEDFVLNNPKYHIKKTNSKAYYKTPYFIKLKSNRSIKYAKDLIMYFISSNRFKTSKNYEEVDYLPLLLPDGKAILSKLNLSDKLYDEISLKKVPDLDIDFLDYIPRYENNLNEEKVYATIYLDTLCVNFDDYSVISIDTIRNMRLMNSGNALRIKARGKIDKKLIIFADEFDDAALRMLIHTNSTAVLVE